METQTKHAQKWATRSWMYAFFDSREVGCTRQSSCFFDKAAQKSICCKPRIVLVVSSQIYLFINVFYLLSMLNLNCVICAELFTQSDEVFVTVCGHMFHHTCLQQWLER